MTLSPGTKLGPYELLSPIGAGGMGEVWKARDTRLGRIVAIKKVKEQHSERFKQEARSIAALPFGRDSSRAGGAWFYDKKITCQLRASDLADLLKWVLS